MALKRKRTGNFLEDFRLGQVFRHKGGRTLTSGLIAHFTDFSYTANPLHKNAELARLYGYADIPVPPGLVMAVAFSQTVEDVSENARANLEYVDVRFGAIVYPGDTLETESSVLGVRGSKSRPDLGVVHVQSVARAIVDRDNALSSDLLANVNPTFSWVRLAQRIPVRIAIDKVPEDVRLSAGMTATVAVDDARK